MTKEAKRIWQLIVWVGFFGCAYGHAGVATEVKSTERGEYVIETLGEIGYLRPRFFSEQGVKKVGGELAKLEEEGVTNLVFDLRTAMKDGGVRETALWLDLFLPKEEVGFRIRGVEGKVAPVRSVSDPSWKGGLVLLVDGETGNVGEILASVLSEKRSALVFGGKTAGRRAFFSEISEEGIERAISAEVLVGAEGTPLSGKPLEPGYRVGFEPEAKARAFAQVEELGIGSVVRENVRPRRSEASLIDGTDPELPYLLAQSAGGEDEVKGDWGLVVDDPVLRAVLDAVVAINALDLEERIEHVKRREFRLEETRRKLEELRKKEDAERAAAEKKTESKEGGDV